MKHAPLEARNITNPDARRTRTEKKAFARLQVKLAVVEETGLQPL